MIDFIAFGTMARTMKENNDKTLSVTPVFIDGDSLTSLKKLKANSVDLLLCSPPYVNLRKDYFKNLDGFISYFLKCSAEIKRILKNEGSM